MKFAQLGCDPEQSGVSTQELKAVEQHLKPEVERLSEALKTGYTTDYGSINLPSDEPMIAQVKQLIEEKQKK